MPSNKCRFSVIHSTVLSFISKLLINDQIYGTILSFHMIPVDTNARLYRRMNGRLLPTTLLHTAVSPRSTGEEAVLCLGWRDTAVATLLYLGTWGLISGKISGDKVCSAESVPASPHLSQDIHIIAASVGSGSPVSVSSPRPARSGLTSWLNLFTLIKNSKCLHPVGEVILGVRSLMILE